MATIFSTMEFVGCNRERSRLVTTSMIFSWSLGNLQWDFYCRGLKSQKEKPEHLLLDFVAAVLDNSLHLLVYKLYTTKARLFKSSDLTLHQKLKTHLICIIYLVLRAMLTLPLAQIMLALAHCCF